MCDQADLYFTATVFFWNLFSRKEAFSAEAECKTRGFIADVIKQCSWNSKNPETYDPELLVVHLEK